MAATEPTVCHRPPSMIFHLSFLDMATSWGILFAFDTLIFALTICNAYFTRIRVGTHAEANMPLYTIIIRDGTPSYPFSLHEVNLTESRCFVFRVSVDLYRFPQANPTAAR
jgi:hypothetical protein